MSNCIREQYLSVHALLAILTNKPLHSTPFHKPFLFILDLTRHTATDV